MCAKFMVKTTSSTADDVPERSTNRHNRKRRSKNINMFVLIFHLVTLIKFNGKIYFMNSQGNNILIRLIIRATSI